MAPDVLTPRHDLTLEAAFTKLHVLIGSGLDGDALERALQGPLCGECTVA